MVVAALCAVSWDVRIKPSSQTIAKDWSFFSRNHENEGWFSI
jgi:hypothetical protein